MLQRAISSNKTNSRGSKFTGSNKNTPVSRFKMSTDNQKKKLALLLPAHNEELILSTTIQSAVKAGQEKRDIFVVDDASTDNTRKIAIEMLGKDHVLTVRKSGKA